MTKTAFLFGAGASHGARGIAPRNPPLGKDLLNEAAKQYPEIIEIIGKFKEEFDSSFESGMAKLMDGRPLTKVSRLYILISRFLSQFHAVNGNDFQKILINSYNRDVTFVTLNYDLLIEDSIELLNSRFFFRTGMFNFKILKLHGSINYIPPISPSLNYVNLVVENSVKLLWCETIIASRDVMNSYIFNDKMPFMPDLCLYMYGKESLYKSGITENLSNAWAECADRADQIIVCGVQINLEDSHVWSPILRNKKKLKYFGTEFDREIFASCFGEGGIDTYFSGGGISSLVDSLKYFGF